MENVFEYCLLGIDWWPMCMTKSEWSGWVQAVGSVAAIGAAWLIGSAQQRATKENNLTLAALDAVTMYAEANSVKGDVDGIERSIFYMLVNKNLVFDVSILGLQSKISQLTLRPLSDQSKLVPVGMPYMASMAGLHQRISHLKQSAAFLHVQFGVDREHAFECLEQLCSAAREAVTNCDEAAKMLKDFAASRKIDLTLPNTEVSKFVKAVSDRG